VYDVFSSFILLRVPPMMNVIIMPDAFFNKNMMMKAMETTVPEIATWQRNDFNKNRTQISFLLPYFFFLKPKMNNPKLSSETEGKPKRRASIIRFSNRCRQMLASTKQNSILRSDYFSFCLYLFSSVIFNNKLNLYTYIWNSL